MAVKKEIIPYGGYSNCVRLSNGLAEVIVTTDVGPRVVRYATEGGPNHMCNFPDQMGKSGGNEWRSYGGHRLWHAPEMHVRTYDPDNSPVEYEFTENGVRLTAAVNPDTHIQKIMEISLDPDSTRVRAEHRLINRGWWEIELSVWCLTVLDKGGICVVKQCQTDTDLLPNRTLTLWPYTRMNDARLTWGDQYMVLRQDPAAAGPCKIGYFDEFGFAAYFNHGQLFVKRFEAEAELPYPDWNCNFEAYTNAEMLECESLSPLQILAHDEEAVYCEEWELYDNVPMPDPTDEPAITAALEGKVSL